MSVNQTNYAIAKSVKAVRFGYEPTSETKGLLENFRAMVNDAIRICIEENINGRLKRKFAGSMREKERIKQTLNVISKHVVEKAIRNREAIILERLKGIRKVHKRGNGEGRDSRRRANLWPFRQLQQQIANKAAWAGIRVEFINPRNTSKECSKCHHVNKKLRVTERSWLCPQCGCQLDRDLNAASSIEDRGKMLCLPAVRAEARGKDEAVKGNEMTTAPILRAEVPKSGG